MTPEQLNDALREVAEYDGWEVIPEGTYTECHNQTIWFGHGGNYDCYHDITAITHLKYHTSYDWLMPVAKKVVEELRYIATHQEIKNNYRTVLERIRELTAHRVEIETAAGLLETPPTTLFASVHSAIQLLTKYKATT